jgi:glycosyltransferase involved in cell wall biosynthesis
MQKVCVIIPCYNEALRLNAGYLTKAILRSGATVLAVNDGSTDLTLDLLQTIAKQLPNQFFILDLQHNAGKAEAVRQGMRYVSAVIPCEYAGFWDADFSTPLEELDWFRYLSGGVLQHDLIIGSRIARQGATIVRHPIRHYIGRFFATAVSLLLRIPLYDTQCGAKLIRSSLIDVAFGEPFSSKWLFDVELIYRLRNHFASTERQPDILEVPLRKWTEIGGSKLRMKDFAQAPISLYHIWRRYGRAGATAAPHRN